MRLIIQHVQQAFVQVKQEVIGKINQGLVVFIAVHKDDTEKDCLWLKEKLVHMRIFADSHQKMNLSIQDIKGEVLVVSQFTLYADCSKSRRPSFTQSARTEVAKKLYERFIEELQRSGLKIETGRFGAHMQVHLVNDGPLTFILDSKEKNLSERI